MSTLILKDVTIAGRDGLQNVIIKDGTIQELTPRADILPGESDAEVLDAEGRAVIPGIVEPHMHLDKALLDQRMPNLDGDLAGAIRVTGALKQKFTVEDCLERSRTVLEWAIAHGTTTVRAHPDVDPIAHLVGMDAMLDLREEFKGRVDLQIVAFPQEGIIKAPETLGLLEESLRRGADVIGGCTYNEPTLEQCHEHIRTVFDLAEKYDVPIDMHCDFEVDDSDPRYGLVEFIADTTIERGMEGRVTLGHMTSLGSLHGDHRIRVWDRIKQAEINIVVLPFTDMHLNARGDDYNVRRGVAPVKLMWDVGVSVGISSNNVRNAFTPFGNADLMDVALFLAQVGHMGAPSDLTALMDTITHRNARIVGVHDGYGLEVGNRADLVVLDAPTPEEALLSRSARRWVLKAGRVIAETTTNTTLA